MLVTVMENYCVMMMIISETIVMQSIQLVTYTMMLELIVNYWPSMVEAVVVLVDYYILRTMVDDVVVDDYANSMLISYCCCCWWWCLLS
jgi:hypothetical protein